MPELHHIPPFLARALTEPWSTTGSLLVRIGAVASGLTGALLGIQVGWHAISPLLQWHHRYTCIEKMKEEKEQRELLTNVVFRSSGPIFLGCALFGGALGYTTGCVLWSVPSSLWSRFFLGSWTGAVLHTMSLFPAQLVSFLSVTYNWLLGNQPVPNRPKNFKLELYERVFHQTWLDSDTSAGFFLIILVGGIIPLVRHQLQRP